MTNEYEQIQVGTLKQHPDNPRQGNVKAIEASIEANGFYGAIFVQKSTRLVLAGNHRLKAARNLGLKTIPVVWVDVDDDTATDILLADNRTSDLAEYDNPILAKLLGSLATLEGTGYDPETLASLQAGLEYPTEDDMDAAFGLVEDGEPEWQTMTFTIHADDKPAIDDAITAAKPQIKNLGLEGNQNGRALWLIASAYHTT